IPSRYLVMTPNGSGVGVSSRIEAEDERERLRSLLETLIVAENAPGGYIVRTAAEGASDDALRADMAFLQRIWKAIESRAGRRPPGGLAYEDLPLPLRVLRDSSGAGTVRVRVDAETTYAQVKEFAEQFVPHLAPVIELYGENRPIFDVYGI